MDRTEEIKKLITEFREYQDSPECAMAPMTATLDLIEKIEAIVGKELGE